MFHTCTMHRQWQKHVDSIHQTAHLCTAPSYAYRTYEAALQKDLQQSRYALCMSTETSRTVRITDGTNNTTQHQIA